jgi:hypothetical protein
MFLLKVTLFAVSLSLIKANYIRINNTGTQNLVFILEAVGHPPNNGTLIEAGNYVSFFCDHQFKE